MSIMRFLFSKTLLMALVSVLAAVALTLDRLFYAQIGSAVDLQSPFLLGLALMFANFVLGIYNLVLMCKSHVRSRGWSALGLLACASALVIWPDDSLGDRYVDWMRIPNQGVYTQLAEQIESGKLRPDANGTLKLPPELAKRSDQRQAVVKGVAPDARIEFPLCDNGSTVLLAVYEPRPVLRLDATDQIWWRYISKKSDHWYIVIWADWD